MPHKVQLRHIPGTGPTQVPRNLVPLGGAALVATPFKLISMR